VERVIKTLKYECLHAFVIVAERHLDHISKQFQAWYNGERCLGDRRIDLKWFRDSPAEAVRLISC